MKTLKALKSLVGFGIIFGGYVYAGTCEIHFTRTACPGKEDISYKKCDGDPSCSEFLESATAEECAKSAVAACENKRLDITKSKVITAKFEESSIQTPAGKEDFCTDYPLVDKEFNQCQK
jgi:hypothetical protein